MVYYTELQLNMWYKYFGLVKYSQHFKKHRLNMLCERRDFFGKRNWKPDTFSGIMNTIIIEI
jgi:hypothetical protein